ncbi:MAG: hypothetical protein Q9192_006943 [Flavoplaca navasiana]
MTSIPPPPPPPPPIPGNSGYGPSRSRADRNPHQPSTAVVESNPPLATWYADSVSGMIARPPESPTFSDDSDISDVPRSGLGRRQNQDLQQVAARPIPRREERQDSERQQVASREARKEDWALLEFVEQQSLFSIASAHRLMGTQNADRQSSELFCNTESLALLSEYIVSTEAEPGRAGFLWAASSILDHELHSGVSRHCLTMRNAAILVQQNFRRLQAGHLANDSLNFLIVQDAGTSTTKKIVELTKLDPYILTDLTSVLNKLSRWLINEDQEPELVVEGIRVCVEELILKCKFEFPSLRIRYPRWSADFVPTVFRESNGARSFGMSAPLEMFLKSVLESVRAIVEIIDFVVLTFAKGHLGPFDTEPLASTGGVFFLHRPPLDVGVLVHRLPLRCLSKMLGGQYVWVFEKLLQHPPAANPCISVRLWKHLQLSGAPSGAFTP